MGIRQRTENLEEKILSPYAMTNNKSLGREYHQNRCDIRTEFQRDRDRIIHCKSFRRLKHKTQVFIAPEGDHYRTRLTHTLEVSQISRTIARALMLNEDLTEAIALGHDLGHTPFGHVGERVLNSITQTGFQHNLQSLRVVEVLEGNRGLNLTWEVRDGIKNHTKSLIPKTLEGQVVALSDRIAYINHDIDDAIRAGIITIDDLPKSAIDILGNSHGKRIDKMILDVVENSMDKPYVQMTKDINKATLELRQFMFDRVYLDSRSNAETKKIVHLMKELFYYFLKSPDKLPQEYVRVIDKNGVEQGVCDYIAGMTDRYALRLFEKLFVPQSGKII